MVRNIERTFDLTNVTPLTLSVLRLLARAPDRWFFVREIARNVGGSYGGCHKVLGNLYSMGLLVRKRTGKNLYYTIQVKEPSIKHFKIFLNLLETRSAIDDIVDRCSMVTLFGSCARGEDTHDSDVDVLVVTHEPQELRRVLVGRDVGGRKLGAIIVSARKMMKMRNDDTALYHEVEKGIVVWREDWDDREGISQMRGEWTAGQD